MAFRFELIDPTNPFSGAKGGVAWVLSEAVYAAAISFGASERSVSTLRWHKPEISSVEACADAVVSEMGAYTDDDDDPTFKELTLGTRFVDRLIARDESGQGPLTVTLDSGVTFSARQMLAALVLRQCELAAHAMNERNVNSVALLMWDVHELLSEIDHQDDLVEGADIVQRNARRAAHMRHKENREMKRQVQDHYMANRGAFASKDAAAEAMAGKLVPMPFRTVRDWLKGI